MTRDGPGRPGLVGPAAIFLLFALLTIVVWWRQVAHQRDLLARHTRDICDQAARRLEARVESRLRVSSIFARRWSTHEGRDFSRQRFVEFSSILVRALKAYHALHLIPAGGGPGWITPRAVASAWPHLGEERARLLEDARQHDALVLSGPVRSSLFAVLPLRRGAEHLGHLVVEFRTEALVGEVFRGRIRSEFDVAVSDGPARLLRYQADPVGSLAGPGVRAARTLQVRNRRWTVTIAPRRAQLASAGWWASLSIPLLGLALSVGMALLFHLLLRRAALYRRARDRALSEIEERERAQRALESSEARYRSVFDSATDGLLIIDGDDRIVEANPAAGAIHGVAATRLRGRPYRELIAPGRAHLYDEFRRQLKQYGSVKLDSVHVTEGGGAVEVEVRGTRFDFGGEPRLLAILTDVSDLRRAVERHTALSRKVLLAQEEERARVSRDLHDELGQMLTALHIELDMLRRKADDSLKGAVANAAGLVEQAATELRRICRGLRPPLLDDLGIEPSVRQLLEELEERTGVRVDLEVALDGERSIPKEVELSAYRILQEALNNITRHARAREINVSLVQRDGELALSVYDNGRGFDTARTTGGRGGCGIAGMQERASLVGGTLDIRSEAFQGTRVVFTAPLSDREPTGEE
jgi:PAS domain S-box-containing protein